MKRIPQYKRPCKVDGCPHHSRCRDMCASHYQMWKVKNIPAFREAQRQSRNKSTAKHRYLPINRYRVGRSNAEKVGMEFNISFEQWQNIALKPCYYCNDFFAHHSSGFNLDRVDSARGYTLDNVVSCCWHCNQLKNNKYSKEEAAAMICVLIDIRSQRRVMLGE